MFSRRYQLYAMSNKKTAEEQNELDKEMGTIFYYTIWIKDAWKLFCTEFKYDYNWRLCYQDEFDKWLEDNYYFV